LVSAEKKGSFFWEIGSTVYKESVKLNKSHFLECFRKEIIEARAVREVQKAIYLNIQNIQDSCLREGYLLNKPLKGFSYDLPLNVIEGIFDFWIEVSKDPDLWKRCLGLLNCYKHFSSSNPFFRNSLKGLTAEMNSKIEFLHSYRPIFRKKSDKTNSPMW
tara:strand:- start:415 stop:894 length:480 start_codon:yes stop_codon:yes gene_type:complete